jgi:O-antigen ligase
MLTGLVCLGFVALSARKISRFAAVVLGTGVFTAIILPTVLKLYNQAPRFQGLTEYDVLGRFAVWKAGLGVFVSAPWGVGPGQFEEGVAGFFGRYAAHNTFLRVLVENGLVGFLLLASGLLVVLGLAVNSVKLALELVDRSWLVDAAWLFSSLAAVMAEGAFIDALHWRHLWVLLGFVVAYHNLLRTGALSGSAGQTGF